MFPITTHDVNHRSRGSYAVGTIQYPNHPNHLSYLLYLKSSLSGQGSTDVCEYGQRKATFLHRSTSDYFNEAQFESYRRLWLHVVDTLMADFPNFELDDANQNLEIVFHNLWKTQHTLPVSVISFIKTWLVVLNLTIGGCYSVYIDSPVEAITR